MLCCHAAIDFSIYMPIIILDKYEQRWANLTEIERNRVAHFQNLVSLTSIRLCLPTKWFDAPPVADSTLRVPDGLSRHVLHQFAEHFWAVRTASGVS